MHSGDSELAAIGQRPLQRLVLRPAGRDHPVGQVKVTEVGPQAAVGGAGARDEVPHEDGAMRGVLAFPLDPVDRVAGRTAAIVPAQQEVPVAGRVGADEVLPSAWIGAHVTHLSTAG